MNIKNFTNNGTVNEVHDSVVAISPQGQQIQQNIIGQPQPEAPAPQGENKPRKAPAASKSKILLRQFKGNDVNFVRVIYALHQEGFFESENGGKPTLKDVFEAFGIAVNERLDDFSAILANNRKDNTPDTRALVFDRLKQAYLNYEQQIDQNKEERK